MPSFQIHRSNRLERLVVALGDLLADGVGGPLTPEAVVVQGRGMEIWLGGELAKRFGVWATRMEYPRGLVDRLVREVLGDAALGDAPLSEDLLGWTVQAVLPDLLAEPEFAALARYVERDEHGVRAFELAGRIATVFDQYLTYRPDWIQRWEADDLSDLPVDDRWQGLLWRRVADQVKRPHLAVAVDRMIERLGQGGGLEGLPPRVLAFGLSTLPPLYVRALSALSRHVDVHVFSFSPAPGLWPPKLRPKAPGTGAGARRGWPELDVDSPFIASLGVLGADFDQVLRGALDGAGIVAREHDHHQRPTGDSLLSRLQADLFDLGAAAAPKLELDPVVAASISIHSCHGPMREVEVLHDQLLDLVTRAEGRVRPDEIVVLVPDLPTYAPLVEAVFEREPGHSEFIPYHVADRSERQGSPVLDGLLRVMDLTRGRVTASHVFDLMVLDPVARRASLDAASIETLRGWVGASGVRWGIDAEHRAQLGVPAGDGNTWRFGLRRLLLGYSMPGDGRRLFEGTLPFDEVEGKDAQLLGTLAWFLRTLFGVLGEFERARPLAEWAATLVSLGDQLFARDRDTTRQLARVVRVLQGAVEDARHAGFTGDVDVQVLRSLLESAAESAGSDRGFLSGGVTFCAMVPMRSIPFRVVALLGMNDGDFPRVPRPIEFDLVRSAKLARRAGDRSRRDDDRHLFLETLCAARERLLVTYTGQSVRDARPRPPSVCLAELLDTLGDRCDLPSPPDEEPDGAADPRQRARRQFVIQHRLQGFNPKYFDGSRPELFGYSTSYAAAAQSLRTGRIESKPFLEKSLQAGEILELRIDELLKFFRSPAAYFLNRRLGLYLRPEAGGLSDREPLEFDTLDDWKLGSSLLDHLLADVPLERAAQLLRAAGELPLGHSGTLEIEEKLAACDAIAKEARAKRAGPAVDPLQLSVETPGGVRITGVLGDRFPGGVVRHMYSSIKAKYLVDAWIRHLGSCAAPGPSARSVLVGRGKGKADVVEWKPLPIDAAVRELGQLVQVYREGLERPLPFLPDTSRKYCLALASGADAALSAAVGAYDDDERGERAYDPHPSRAFDDALPPFDRRFDAGERGVEETDFHRIATLVYGPLDAARGGGEP
jgi:exodeoxyribonuclease V gamma subunit